MPTPLDGLSPPTTAPEIAMEWFSSMVRLALRRDDSTVITYMECVHVFRASDWDAAFQTALRLGRAHEDEYVNAEGERVRWRLKQVVSLDVLRDGLDGAEVYSRFVDPPREDASPVGEFTPERSDPVQTL